MKEIKELKFQELTLRQKLGLGFSILNLFSYPLKNTDGFRLYFYVQEFIEFLKTVGVTPRYFLNVRVK